MCGLAGILGDQRPAESVAEDVRRMTEALEHRGPDDSGVEAGDGWALGLRRLAVQDPSEAGHQPMTRGNLTIVFNGEVYNFPELRRELRERGYEFASNGDTEVVLNAFREWGVDCFARFNGMFALAIVDRERGRAWLARDRFGKKPLFLAWVGTRLLFASELKAIIPLVRNELSLSPTALASYFRFLYVPTPLSIFTEVEKLSAASWLELRLDEPTERRSQGTYWAFPTHTSHAGRVGADEVYEAIRESVRRRLIADVPLGAFLSGGIDSSLVVASMRDLAADVRTFSIGFEDERYDESAHARAVAEYLETNHSESTLSAAEARNLLLEMPTVYDEPFADSSAIPTMAVARLARRDVTVALSGDGGDELFGGYERYLCRSAAPARWIPRWPARAIAGSERMRQRHARISAFASAPSFGAGYQELAAAWRRDELRRLLPDAAPLDSVATHVDSAAGGAVERMMRADASTYLVDDILQKVDRATMAVSLEARNPILDPDVARIAVEAIGIAERAPAEKRLLRNALRQRLPDALVDRPKKGFSVPVGEWLRDPLRPLLEDLVIDRTEAEYDLGVAKTLCQSHLREEITATPRVWSLLAFELWRQRWWS